MLQTLVVISLKFCCRKEALCYAKVIHKKWISVQNIENNGYSDARLEKEEEMNKIAHALLQSCFQFQKRDMFSRSIVELG